MATEKELLAKYMEFYHAYKSHNEEYNKLLYISAMLQGVCFEIIHEITKYKAKYLKSPESAENRLKIIELALGKFDYLINENFRQKELNNQLMNKNAMLEEKVKDLQDKIDNIIDYNS